MNESAGADEVLNEHLDFLSLPKLCLRWIAHTYSVWAFGEMRRIRQIPYPSCGMLYTQNPKKIRVYFANLFAPVVVNREVPGEDSRLGDTYSSKCTLSE